MSYRDYIGKNYELLLQTTKNITKNHEDSDDLLSEVLIQLLTKLPKVKEGQELYYFIKVLKLNWFSKTSRFHYNFRKKLNDNMISNSGGDFVENLEGEETYDETEFPSIEWVDIEINKLHWFSRDLWKCWVELGTITSVSNKTTIPMNSCSRYIRDIKRGLVREWNYQNNRLR